MKTDYNQIAHQVWRLQSKAFALRARDTIGLHGLTQRIKTIIRNVYGDDCVFLSDLANIDKGVDAAEDDQEWERNRQEFKDLCSVVKEGLDEMSFEQAADSSQTAPKSRAMNSTNDVFVVHGHDDLMQVEVARVIEKLGLHPIILHEQPDRGRTIIEKFEDHSADVGFAVVLFSPDDKGFSATSGPDGAKPRARQNVVLELGFFLGKLTRKRVLVLYRTVPDFDMPSDYAGVLFKPYEPNGAWKLELVKELKAAGYNVDANRL